MNETEQEEKLNHLPVKLLSSGTRTYPEPDGTLRKEEGQASFILLPERLAHSPEPEPDVTPLPFPPPEL